MKYLFTEFGVTHKSQCEIEVYWYKTKRKQFVKELSAILKQLHAHIQHTRAHNQSKNKTAAATTEITIIV